MCKIYCEEAAWRRGARERKRAGRSGETYSDFTTLTSRDLGAVQRTLGVGGCGNNCFGLVLVAVRKSQRRDAVATVIEQLGSFTTRKSKYIFSRRRTFDEFFSMAEALWRALQH
jgi:hypothetical protein